MSAYLDMLIKKNETVISKDYISWLKEFLERFSNFNDETILYESNISEYDTKNIGMISTLFNIILSYYEYMNIKAKSISSLYDIFVNKKPKKDTSSFPSFIVSVNFEDFSAEFILTVGQGALTSVEKIENGTGLCDFSDILKFNEIIEKHREKIITRIKSCKE